MKSFPLAPMGVLAPVSAYAGKFLSSHLNPNAFGFVLLQNFKTVGTNPSWRNSPFWLFSAQNFHWKPNIFVT